MPALALVALVALGIFAFTRKDDGKDDAPPELGEPPRRRTPPRRTPPREAPRAEPAGPVIAPVPQGVTTAFAPQGLPQAPLPVQCPFPLSPQPDPNAFWDPIGCQWLMPSPPGWETPVHPAP